MLFSGCRVLAGDQISFLPPSSGRAVLIGDEGLFSVLTSGEGSLAGGPALFEVPPMTHPCRPQHAKKCKRQYIDFCIFLFVNLLTDSAIL